MYQLCTLPIISFPALPLFFISCMVRSEVSYFETVLKLRTIRAQVRRAQLKKTFLETPLRCPLVTEVHQVLLARLNSVHIECKTFNGNDQTNLSYHQYTASRSLTGNHPTRYGFLSSHSSPVPPSGIIPLPSAVPNISLFVCFIFP